MFQAPWGRECNFCTLETDPSRASLTLGYATTVSSRRPDPGSGGHLRRPLRGTRCPRPLPPGLVEHAITRLAEQKLLEVHAPRGERLGWLDLDLTLVRSEQAPANLPIADTP